ncbi:MAG: bifunctional serine/threonine-protein kinase/formylglycine-generating enzyme family protein, partial [Acidobacteriota bacterium]
MPQANDRIGPYTLIRQLGRGAYGIVWLAERRSALVTTQVAIKLALDEEPDLTAIAQESQLWASLGGHPNVLPIIEADIYDGQVAIVSEYAPDGSLESWLNRQGGCAPTIEAALSMATGILAGLEHLHSKKIIHRDLKPANILLQGETPRLADFGLARVLKGSAHSGAIAGTPAYMAPEVFDGKRSELSDLWAAGVILYQLLTGHKPFAHADLGALIGAIMLKMPDPLPAFVPLPLQEVITRALEKDPTRRYQSAQEMRTALQACSAHTMKLVALPGNFTGSLLDDLPTNRVWPLMETASTLAMPKRTDTVELMPILDSYEFNYVVLDAKGRVTTSGKGQAQYFLEDLGGLSLVMVQLPAGRFLMGSSENEKGRGLDEGPTRWVTATPFYMSKFPITQPQWRAVANLPKVYRELNPNPSNFVGDDLPVEQVSWEEAQEFCARLSRKTGKRYSLPTEAQWEYACRAGTTTPFAFGETVTAEQVNYNGNYPYAGAPKGIYREQTTVVGSLGVANGFGLYDMHGNVWEWCMDIYGNYHAASSDANNWTEGSNEILRVLRGGCWHNLASFCRSAYRNRNLPVFRNLNLGFRVV